MTARLLDAIVVEPVDALVDQREHLPTGALLPPLGVDGPGPHPAEETLRGRRLDLGDVRQPLLVGAFGGEVPGNQVAWSGSRLALVGTVPATSGNMRHGPVLGHDPSDHLLRDAGSERGLDPAAPVTALGRGERIGHLPHQRVPQTPIPRPCGAAPPRHRHRRGSRHAELPGDLPLPHAAQYRFNRLLPGFQGDDGAPHTPGMTGILRQPAFQALPGRITETFDHFGGRR